MPTHFKRINFDKRFYLHKCCQLWNTCLFVFISVFLFRRFEVERWMTLEQITTLATKTHLLYLFDRNRRTKITKNVELRPVVFFEHDVICLIMLRCGTIWNSEKSKSTGLPHWDDLAWFDLAQRHKLVFLWVELSHLGQSMVCIPLSQPLNDDLRAKER